MRKIFAMMRASWQAASSYKLNMVWSLLALVISVIPLYYVTRAFQPFMASRIQGEGGQFFAFVLVGQIAFWSLSSAMTTLPGTISASIGSGTLELLLSTPTRLPTLFAGMVSYTFTLTAVRCLLLLTTGWVLGATIAWDKLAIAAVILGLIVVTYLCIGVIVAAMVLAFRFTGPVVQAVLVSSALLGGVYYPTRVIPSWIREISDFIPLTYGLRALRGTLLEEASLSAVAGDVGMLLLFCVTLLAASSLAILLALDYSKRAGTLSQY
jgi:ABC-2 type transport system permease protein